MRLRDFAVGLAVLVSCGSATATTLVTATYSGTVSSLGPGGDVEGFFGPAGGDLTGDAFTSTYVFSLPTGPASPYSGGTFESVDLSINGKSLFYDAAQGLTGSVENYVATRPLQVLSQSGAFVTNQAALTMFIEMSLDYPVPPGTYSYDGTTFTGERVGGSDSGEFSYGFFTGEQIYFNVTDFTITGTPDLPLFIGANVPEPAAWLLMLTGTGVVGATMRMRRAKKNGADERTRTSTPYGAGT